MGKRHSTALVSRSKLGCSRTDCDFECKQVQEQEVNGVPVESSFMNVPFDLSAMWIAKRHCTHYSRCVKDSLQPKAGDPDSRDRPNGPLLHSHPVVPSYSNENATALKSRWKTQLLTPFGWRFIIPQSSSSEIAMWHCERPRVATGHSPPLRSLGSRSELRWVLQLKPRLCWRPTTSSSTRLLTHF